MKSKKVQKEEFAVYEKIKEALDKHFLQSKDMPSEEFMGELAHKHSFGTNCLVITKVVFEIQMDTGTITLEKSMPWAGEGDINLVFAREGNSPVGHSYVYNSSGSNYNEELFGVEASFNGFDATNDLIQKYLIDKSTEN